MANWMVYLSSQGNKHNSNINPIPSSSPSSATRVYQCKTCDRRFSSFQALGGHRASHRKTRNMIVEEDDPCEEDNYDQERGVPYNRDYQNNSTCGPKWKNKKAHECPICGVAFAIGQALGGHMRRHRNMNSSDLLHDPPDSSVQTATTTTSSTKEKSNSGSFLCLDLNLTPLENDLKLDDIGSECSRKINPPILNFFI